MVLAVDSMLDYVKSALKVGNNWVKQKIFDFFKKYIALLMYSSSSIHFEVSTSVGLNNKVIVKIRITVIKKIKKYNNQYNIIKMFTMTTKGSSRQVNSIYFLSKSASSIVKQSNWTKMGNMIPFYGSCI